MNTPQQPTSTKEIVALCYNILDTACQENVTQSIGPGMQEYSIVDTSDNTNILSARRTAKNPFLQSAPEYNIYLYGQRLILTQEESKRLYHSISEICFTIINEKEKTENQKRKEEADKRLQANIAKAKEYLKRATFSPNQN